MIKSQVMAVLGLPDAGKAQVWEGRLLGSRESRASACPPQVMTPLLVLKRLASNSLNMLWLFSNPA